MKKFITFFLAFSMIITLCGCQINPDTTSSAESDAASHSYGLEKIQSKMSKSIKKMGVIFLGFYESYEEYIIGAEKTYGKDYPFLKNIKEEAFVASSEGSEIFAIIPANNRISLTVNRLSYTNGFETAQKGDLLYEGRPGEPVVVKCNFSDLYPDIIITATSTDSDAATEFVPKLSLKDGRIELEEEEQLSVHDFTEYKI